MRYLTANIYQKLIPAKGADNAVNIPESKKETNITYRPPNHSDIVPPNNDVVKYPQK